MTEKPYTIRQGLQMIAEAAKEKTVPIDKATPRKPPKAKKPTAKIPGQEPETDTVTKESAVRKIRGIANRGSAGELVEAKKGRKALEEFAAEHELEFGQVKESFIGWAEARGYSKQPVSTQMVAEWLASLGK